MSNLDILNSSLALLVPFMLVLCRVVGAVALLPGIGETESPVVLRGGIVTAIAVLLTPALAPLYKATPDHFILFSRLVAGELLIGLMIGWLARTASLALPMAGQVISLMTGLSSVLQPDPDLGAQSAVVGRLFGMAVPVLMLTSGLYELPLMALSRSYAVLPPGGPLPSGDVLQTVITGFSGAMMVALQLAAPFILINMVWQVGLGLLARLVPQLQIYFASLPGQILGGLAMLAWLASLCTEHAIDAMRTAFLALPGG